MLQGMKSQRVGQDLMTEQQQKLGRERSAHRFGLLKFTTFSRENCHQDWPLVHP